MKFGQATQLMQEGKKVQREGWNGKGMFLFLVGAEQWGFEAYVSGVDLLATEPFVCMKTAGDTLIPWLASQADILANDWQEVEA
jgi:hypothetical protein